jgi:hypothetical protein
LRMRAMSNEKRHSRKQEGGAGGCPKPAR